jgi:hypothetical protein
MCKKARLDMLSEDEAFWAGIAVATVMLGIGFSVLFIRTYTGFGAIILSIGLMTLTFTIHMRAIHNERIEYGSSIESNILTSKSLVESANEIADTQLTSEIVQSEAKTDQLPSETFTESTQTRTAQETAESTAPSEQVEINQAPKENEPNEPVEYLESYEPDQSDESNMPAEPASTGLVQPSEPEASEPAGIEEETSEEPQVVTAAN